MNQMLDWLPADGWQRFVADAIWQSTVTGLLGLVCVCLIARRPSTRALLCITTIVAAMALPIASVMARFAGWGIFPSRSTSESASSEGVIDTHVAKSGRQEAGATEDYVPGGNQSVAARSPATVRSAAREHTSSPLRQTQPTNVAEPTMRVAFILLLAWFATSGLVFVRLLINGWQTFRLLATAVPYQGDALSAIAQDAARRVGVREPRILVSDRVDSPTVFAFGRGAIVLPSAGNKLPLRTARNPSEPCAGLHAGWLAIFCHELGHVRRGDGWNRLIAEVGVALLPWQPLVWLLRRKFVQHSEEACDDWAVASGADAVEMAALFTDLIPSLSPLSLGASVMATDAKTRILRLLALDHVPQPRTSRVQAAVFLAVLLLATTGAALAQRQNTEQTVQQPPNATNVSASQKSSAERDATSVPTYVLEPPDVIEIETVKLLPKGRLTIQKLDRVEIKATGTIFEHPIRTTYTVDEDGEVNLGPEYGRVEVAGLPVKEATSKIGAHLTKILREPKVSLSVVDRAEHKHVAGIRLIGPDGFVNLVALGQVYVAGMKIEEARQAIEKHLSKRFDEPSIAVEVHSYNSKVYYVIVDGRGKGDQIVRFPLNGKVTVLDAIAQAELRIDPQVKIWISRVNPSKDAFEELTVDWKQFARGGRAETNYQLTPGDRVFVEGAERDGKHTAQDF